MGLLETEIALDGGVREGYIIKLHSIYLKLAKTNENTSLLLLLEFLLKLLLLQTSINLFWT